VSCYAFFKWWLLLSLHPYCLRFKTTFVTLSIYFGTLTWVSLVRVLERYLTHRPPLPWYTVNMFRVGKSSVAVRLCKLYPYFTTPTSTTKLYWGIFRQEQAIARLDRLFTPIRRSSKHVHVAPVRTSILLSKNFILPTNRSSGFVSNPRDWRRFRLAFAAASCINLATKINSLDHFSTRTLRHLNAVTSCHCQISSLFTLV